MTTTPRRAGEPVKHFRLPDLGEGLTEAEIIRWLVDVGDTVTTDQPVVEVETAKAAVEVPCPYQGVVAKLHGEPGDVLDVGAPLISIAEPGDGPRPAPDTAVPTALADSAGDGVAAADSGNVLVGYGTRPANRRRRRVLGSPGADGRHAAAAEPVPRSAARGAPGSKPAVISPVVRRLAREHGLDLTRVAGTGPDGLILRRDVEQAVAAARRAAGSVSPAHPAGPAGERIPLRGLRRAIADKLTRSRREIPDATTWVDVDATELLAARSALNASGDSPPIGLLALLARFCVAGLKRYPELNSYVDVERAEIVRLPYVHLGFAAQTERGLVVPVVRNAHQLSTAKLAAEIARLTEAARAGALEPADLTGGTFTLNNYGVFGVDGSSAIINHPEAAILGVGRIIDRPWVVDGQLTVRKVTQLSLSFDHRVCDGGAAGGFLRYVADLVERPYTLLRQV
ncbi:branched-chain alpha-keto acid dehydrogenase subunit E2 [Carbonactinospora thermoautotrophica]|uniref:Dihydrolipoamide acetyltransferase component of pyruvate dehydrogenase complex n=3 Tax=Carbonactinospora thermoautotrophica TaxID=1469144 RepID=A0A132N4X6_9ACTN|nr:dihydrolipoamide acetyltransferase family protein [Carbonactinospora thermoautotrophica]KWX05046.1 branched-chain alpha-keto acid dehydrogenase subunit E2 [Carbonactinospora thermoautotrophica]